MAYLKLLASPEKGDWDILKYYQFLSNMVIAVLADFLYFLSIAIIDSHLYTHTRKEKSGGLHASRPKGCNLYLLKKQANNFKILKNSNLSWMVAPKFIFR